jgi:hypothetical protein
MNEATIGPAPHIVSEDNLLNTATVCHVIYSLIFLSQFSGFPDSRKQSRVARHGYIN